MAATIFILWTLKIGFVDFQNFLYRMGSDCCIRVFGILIIVKIRLVPEARIPDIWYVSEAKHASTYSTNKKKKSAPIKSLF